MHFAQTAIIVATSLFATLACTVPGRSQTTATNSHVQHATLEARHAPVGATPVEDRTASLAQQVADLQARVRKVEGASGEGRPGDDSRGGVPIAAAAPTGMAAMTTGSGGGATMMEDCKKRMQERKAMMAEMAAQDTALSQQVAKLNSAPEDQKLDLIAATLTRLVEQRVAMAPRMEQMHSEMMQHMMEHMQMGKDSMEKCPMIKGMKDMKDMKGMKDMKDMKDMKSDASGGAGTTRE